MPVPPDCSGVVFSRFPAEPFQPRKQDEFMLPHRGSSLVPEKVLILFSINAFIV